MEKRTYIQTDDNTVHLVKLLLLELKELKAKVSMLSNPLENAKLFTEDKAAELLGISKSSLIKLRKEHKIHFHQIGTSIRYSLEDILEFEERCKK
jgi:excisionase family DNA binding protein